MSPRVVFYDVQPDAWDAWLHKLAAAAWDRTGARLMILVDGPARAEALDTMLWSFRDESFLPCLLYTSPSPRDQRGSRMPSSA